MQFLEDVLPEFVWIEAEKQAYRSTLKNYRTGAVIFHKKDMTILARGCSHVPQSENVMSVHAEGHALDNFNKEYSGSFQTGILVVCINKADNYAFSARPCAHCADRLRVGGINTVYYAERINDGTWICNIESPKELVDRTDKSRTSYAKYAKEMRIV